jgi:hypothetical protein
MVRQVYEQRRTPRAAVAVLAAVAFGLGLAGCGADKFPNDARAPAPIGVDAVIAPSRVTVAPSRIGAGTIELTASNQTRTSQRVTLRSSGAGRLEQTTGPINPGDTASLTATLTKGSYLVTARSAAIDPATLVVGRPRSGSAAGLLQP